MVVRPVLCGPFIGRREELAFLHERRRRAAASHGSLVLVSGDAGIGKSRLVREFGDSLANSRWRIVRGTCTEFAVRPYGPILDALSGLDDGDGDLVPAVTRREQIDAVVARIRAIAARKALVVAIEDVHWADVATLGLLARLGGELATTRALFVATMRPDGMRSDAPNAAALAGVARSARGGRIDLTPLEGAELRAFVDEALAGFALSDRMRREIARAGEGNPFYTEELLKSAVERGASPAAAAAPLPQTISASLSERMRSFDGGERRVIAQAAVIGRTFGLDLLAETAGAEPADLLPALRRARDVQLIEELEPRVFRFRHGLTRQAIYADFLRAELRPLHRTVALALERGPEPGRSLEALAYHWWSAGGGERSAHFNALAGDSAAKLHAHEDAIAYYERALEWDGLDAPARATLLEKIAEQRIALSATEEAHATYSAAADLYRSTERFEREASCRVHAAIMAYTSALPEPTAPLDAMLERLDPSEYLARSRVHLGLAWLAATFWFPTRAAHHLASVDARATTEAPDIGLRYHNVAAWVAMTVGDLAAFHREHALWIEAARAADSVRTLVAAHLNGAMCLSFFGRHGEALQHIDHAFRIARAARNRYAEENCHAFAALCHLTRGDLEAARASVAAIPATTENHVNFTFAAAWGTIAGAYLDDHAMIEKWFDGVEASGTRVLETECGAGFAEIMSRRGRVADAAALLHRVLPDCELIRGNVPTLLAVGQYGAEADRVRARAYLARAAVGPVEMPERPALALYDARDCAGTDAARAARLARDAADGFRRLGLPLLEAAALEVAGEPAAALALYRRHGARYDVRRLGGEKDAVPFELDAGGDALSSREREIAALAARGRSNVEIARALSISHKTVEKHLASTFQKLGISSRRELRSGAADATVVLRNG